MALACAGLAVSMPQGQGGLYRAAPPALCARPLLWIPYYAWANRAAGEMAVWVHTVLS